MKWAWTHLGAIVAISLLLSTSSLADGLVPAADGAMSELVKQGILGALCVLEGICMVFLYREARSKDARILEMAVEQTKVLAATQQTLDRALRALGHP